MSITVVPSRASGGAGTTFTDAVQISSEPSKLHVMQWILDVTAAAAGAGDSLGVFIQTDIADDPSNPVWLDVVAFTSVLGNGGVQQVIGKQMSTQNQAMYSVSAALAAGNVRQILSSRWRAKVVVAGGTANFTFRVLVKPIFYT